MTEADLSLDLQERVLQAYREESPLRIRGSGSKDFYGLPVEVDSLSLREHQGLIAHEPTELILSARSGTSLQVIEDTLAEQGQMLACEPPHFGPEASFGGAIASGLCGPRRPYGGSFSDLLLGAKVLNGRGEILNFGGRVMKNVAGYDLSRLMNASMGCLGIILEATIKVLPKPPCDRSLSVSVPQGDSAGTVNALTKKGYPVTASSHDGEKLRIRFSGSEAEIARFFSLFDVDFPQLSWNDDVEEAYWLALREQQVDFFRTDKNLWRLSVPPDTPDLGIPGDKFYEWHGALRWIKTDMAAQEIFRITTARGGAATLFRRGKKGAANSGVFQSLDPGLLKWHRQLKAAFDPKGILNPGRMFQDF